MASEHSSQPEDRHSSYSRKSISIDATRLMGAFASRSVINMSDREENVRTPDSANDSVYASPGSVFFATENDSSPNAYRTPMSDLAQREAEETYFTPSFQNFLQWRQMDQSPDDSPFTSVPRTNDERTPDPSLGNESLIEQINMLSLSMRKYSHASVSTPAKADATVTNVKSIFGRRNVREDLSARISRVEHPTNAERSRIVDRDGISARDRATDELTSDYSTMESANVPDNDGSSSKVTSDSSIDQLPPRGSKQSDRPGRGDAIVDSAEPKTKEARNLVIAESTRLTDRSTTSFGKPSVIGDGEVFETETFDDRYSRNIELVQNYVEQMMTDKQAGGCFRSHWSKKIMNMSTLCRSPQRSKKSKEKKSQSCVNAKASSPVRDGVKTSPDVPERRSPSLRFYRVEPRRPAQTFERFNPGNASHLDGKWPIDDRGVPRSNNNDFNLEYVFAIRLGRRCEILSAMVPRCRPPVTCFLVNRYRSMPIEISNFYLLRGLTCVDVDTLREKSRTNN